MAGSERLASSGAGENKDRLKETININKSLSALADVIGALGQGQQGGHVPYRNSTLTRLLQTSLSGMSPLYLSCLLPLGSEDREEPGSNRIELPLMSRLKQDTHDVQSFPTGGSFGRITV